MPLMPQSWWLNIQSRWDVSTSEQRQLEKSLIKLQGVGRTIVVFPQNTTHDSALTCTELVFNGSTEEK